MRPTDCGDALHIFTKCGSRQFKFAFGTMKLLLLLGVLAVASTVAQEVVNVVPNYDFPDEKVRIYYIKRPLVLKCVLSVQGEYEVQWIKDGRPVGEVESLKNRYSTSGGEFKVQTSAEEDAGNYECLFPVVNLRASIEVLANVQVALTSDMNVVESETLHLTCAVVGTQPLISWLVGNESYTESRDRIVLEEDNGVANARLIMADVQLDDRNYFTCIARNKASQLLGENAEATTLLRVRSKYAAFWPFLGICIEVLVLCVAIWICERRRLSKMADESDDEMEANVKGNSRSNIRQRH